MISIALEVNFVIIVGCVKRLGVHTQLLSFEQLVCVQPRM